MRLKSHPHTGSWQLKTQRCQTICETTVNLCCVVPYRISSQHPQANQITLQKYYNHKPEDLIHFQTAPKPIQISKVPGDNFYSSWAKHKHGVPFRTSHIFTLGDSPNPDTIKPTECKQCLINCSPFVQTPTSVCPAEGALPLHSATMPEVLHGNLFACSLFSHKAHLTALGKLVLRCRW